MAWNVWARCATLEAEVEAQRRELAVEQVSAVAADVRAIRNRFSLAEVAGRKGRR